MLFSHVVKIRYTVQWKKRICKTKLKKAFSE